MADEVFIEVDLPLKKVVGRTREPRGYFREEERDRLSPARVMSEDGRDGKRWGGSIHGIQRKFDREIVSYHRRGGNNRSGAGHTNKRDLLVHKILRGRRHLTQLPVFLLDELPSEQAPPSSPPPTCHVVWLRLEKPLDTRPEQKSLCDPQQPLCKASSECTHGRGSRTVRARPAHKALTTHARRTDPVPPPTDPTRALRQRFSSPG